MDTILSYFIKSSIWLSAFWLVYYLFLQNEGYFVLNRIFLIVGMLSAFVFPLVTIKYLVELPKPVTSISATASNAVAMAYEGSTTIGWESIVVGVMLSGATFVLIRLLIQTLKVIQVIHITKADYRNGLKVIETNQFPSAFSFFTYVVVNPLSSEKAKQEMVAHEAAHVKQLHWIDLVLAEVLCVLQWYNPIAWWYGHFIRQNHEYLADRSALRSTADPAVYKAVLINQLIGDEVIRLGHPFSYSINQKRFNMMKNTSVSNIRRLKLLIVLPLAASILYAFAEPEYVLVSNQVTTDKFMPTDVDEALQPEVSSDQTPVAADVQNENVEANESPTLETHSATDMDKLHAVGEIEASNERVLPVSGAMNVSIQIKDSSATAEEAFFGADKAFDKHPLVILDGEEIPFEDLKKVDPNSIQKIDVLKDETSTERYGKKGENGVILIFSKQEDDASGRNSTGQSSGEQVMIRSKTGNTSGTVDERAQFPGGEQAMMDYVAAHVKYPKSVRKEGVTGKVYVSFTITETGKIANVKLAKGLDSRLDEEALSLVKSMPDWIPAREDGENVSMEYVLPIAFGVS